MRPLCRHLYTHLCNACAIAERGICDYRGRLPPPLVLQSYPIDTRSNNNSSSVLGFLRYFARAERLVSFVHRERRWDSTDSVPRVAFFTDVVLIPGDIKTLVARTSVTASQNNIVKTFGICVDATSKIVVSGLSEGPFTSGAFLGLPSNVVATNYIVLGCTVLPAEISVASAFLVLAGEVDTVVSITLILSSIGCVQGFSYNTSLDALDTCQLLSDARGEDASGTIVTSTKSVAGFGGSSCVTVLCRQGPLTTSPSSFLQLTRGAPPCSR